MVKDKLMLEVFLHCQGVVHYKFIPEGKTVIQKCPLTSFVALDLRSERIASKNEEPTAGFSFATMLQHTGRFCSMIS